MNRQILDARKAAISAIIKSAGGRKNAAAVLQMKNERQFDNHAYQHGGCSPLTDAQLFALEQVSRTQHFPNYVAKMYGGLFVKLAAPEQLDNIELYTLSVQVAAKRGKVDQIIAKALDDGSIDDGEAQAILAAHDQHMSARHTEVLAAIELHRPHLEHAL